jgi:outer membrane cobalamin receptor
MNENETICWRYGHSKGRNAKGMNKLGTFYPSENERGEIQAPIDCQITAKTKLEADAKTGKEGRASEKTKSEMTREMTALELQKRVEFGHILADSWFRSDENMRFIKKKAFILK